MRVECTRLGLTADPFAAPISKRTSKLMKQINGGKSINLRQLTAYELASLWRAFFALLTTSLLPSFNAGYDEMDKNTRKFDMNVVFEHLPKEHVKTFLNVLTFLEDFMESMIKVGVNTMNSEYLANILTRYLVFRDQEAKCPKKFVEYMIDAHVYKNIPPDQPSLSDELASEVAIIPRWFDLGDHFCLDPMPNSYEATIW